MLLGYVYKMKPSQEQLSKIDSWLDMLRASYNYNLADRINTYESRFIHGDYCVIKTKSEACPLTCAVGGANGYPWKISGEQKVKKQQDALIYGDYCEIEAKKEIKAACIKPAKRNAGEIQMAELPGLKAARPWYKQIDSTVLQENIKRLDTAYEKFLISGVSTKTRGKVPMNLITHKINSFPIEQRKKDGYLNLTAMAQSKGKEIIEYLKLYKTNIFIYKLSVEIGIPVLGRSGIIQVRKNRNQAIESIWAHPQIAIHCAQWCEDKFAFIVSKWIFDWVKYTNQEDLKCIDYIYQYSLNAQSYLENFRAINALMNTVIHNQSDTLDVALQVLSNNAYKKDLFDQRFIANNLFNSTPKPKNLPTWYTPQYLIDLVIKVLGKIDLDPCADEGKNIPARLHYTAEDDGLCREWSGNVYMNPPYTCPRRWTIKLHQEFTSGRVKEAIALVPAITYSNWFQSMMATQHILFWGDKIKFLNYKYQPTLTSRQAYSFIYWGDNKQLFKDTFKSYGFLCCPENIIAPKKK